MEQISTFGASGYRTDHLHLFRDVGEVQGLLADCPVVRVGLGQSVLENNDRGGRLYIVLRGILSVEPATSSGNQADGASIRVLPGECVGELSVLDGEATSSAIAAEQETDLLVIEADRLWKLIEESNGVARNLLRLLSFRVRAANAQSRRRQKVGEFYRQLSTRDGLTGLYNRAWLDENLSPMIAEARADSKPLAIMMIDLDHFKQFNDAHGHPPGDEALKTAARVLNDELRPSDFAVRYGGEEMLVILPDTSEKVGVAVAQRLCDRLRQAVVFGDMRKPLPHITASFGVAGLSSMHNTIGLITAADDALYRAKEAGRNRVAAAG